MTLMQLRARLRKQEEGATTLEYIVLAAVLVLGLVGAVQYFQGQASQSLQAEGDALNNVATGAWQEVGEQYNGTGN